jgi:DNA-binding NarL/FixJ family response regulator
MAITVFLADKHGVVRDGLSLLLEAQSDISVAGQAANGRDAVRAVRRLRPDVVLMDSALPELNGIEATVEIRQACPSTGVLILSPSCAIEPIFRALRAGAQGYVLMESSGAELVAAVRAVHAGQRYLSQSITGAVLDDYARERHGASPLDSLSRRERQILQLVAEGKSSANAAKLLFLSPKTVETYRSRLMRKLGVENFSGLIKFAIEHGVIALD